MTHRQRMGRSGSAVMEHAVGEWRQHLPHMHMSTCCNKDDLI